MTGPLTLSAFEMLVAGDLEWLAEQPNTLERRHIEMILRDAVTNYSVRMRDLLGQEPAEKNPAAVVLGKLGGAKGGNARAAVLPESRRKEIARRAANTRWSRKKRTN